MLIAKQCTCPYPLLAFALASLCNPCPCPPSGGKKGAKGCMVVQIVDLQQVHFLAPKGACARRFDCLRLTNLRFDCLRQRQRKAYKSKICMPTYLYTDNDPFSSLSNKGKAIILGQRVCNWCKKIKVRFV